MTEPLGNGPTDLYPFDVLLDQPTMVGGRSLYYDRHGEPIGLARFARLNEIGDAEYGPTRRHYKVVKQHDVGPWFVSTVWLGIDHGFSYEPGAPPMIFETMVFRRDDGPSGDFDLTRYSTEEQASAGHDATVLVVRAVCEGDVTPEQVWPEA